jgi:hypothetical protein
MLMVTPAALLRLRSETRAPVSLAPMRPAPTKKLPRHRREAIVDKLAAMMRRAEPTPFAIEGPARAGIRARLCSIGWRWGQADAVADEVVQAALARVGAKRPTWKEGQPEHTQEAVMPLLRERCARCGKSLPDDVHGGVKYCGPVCARSARLARYQQHDEEARYARDRAYRIAWSEKQEERECPGCGRAFRPMRNGIKYCSTKCVHDVRRFEFRRLRMVCEEVQTDSNGS